MLRARASRLAIIQVLAILAAAGSAAAQPQTSLTPGQRVRITVPSVGIVEMAATLVAVSADTVVLSGAESSNGRQWTIPLSAVGRLEVIRGGQGRWKWLGAAVGALAGGGMGFVSTRDARDDPCEWMFCGRSASSKKFTAVFFGAAAGGLIGLLAGHAISAERWEPVALDRFQVGLSSSAGGSLSLGASIAF